MLRTCFLYLITLLTIPALQAQQRFLGTINHSTTDYSLCPSSTDSNGTLYLAYPHTDGVVLSTFDTSGYIRRESLFKTGQKLLPNGLTTHSKYVIVAGLTPFNGNDGIFVLKTDTLGNIIWFKVFGNPYRFGVRNIAADAQGNIMVCGHYYDPNRPGSAFFLLLGANGNVKGYSAIETGRTFPHFNTVVAIKEGGFILNGLLGQGMDYFASMVVKTDINGTIEWLKAYRMPLPQGDYNLMVPGRRSATMGGGIAQIDANTFALGGYVSDHNAIGAQATFWEPYLALIDKDGKLKSAKRYYNPNRKFENQVFSLKLFSDNTIHLAGTFDNRRASFILKTDLNGYPFTEKVFDFGVVVGAPNIESEMFSSLSESPSGNCWVSGTYSSPFLTSFLYNPIIGHIDMEENTCFSGKAEFAAWDLTFDVLEPSYTVQEIIAEKPATISKECACSEMNTRCGKSGLNIDIALRYTQCADKEMTFTASTNRVNACDSSKNIYRWAVSDPTGSTITYTGDSIKIQPNHYFVSVETSNTGCKLQGTKQIDFTPPVIPDLGSDTTYCDVPEKKIIPSDTSQNFLWSTGETAKFITIRNPGTYWARSILCPETDSVTVNFVSKPNLGPDLVFCESMPSVTLKAEKKGFTYAWSTGETTAEITATNRGLYWAEISNDTCTLRDSMHIFIVFDTALNIGPDTSFCIGTSFDHSLHAAISGTGTKYLWSTNDTMQNLNVTKEGEYWVRVTQGNCMVEDTIMIRKLGESQLNDLDNCLEKRPEFIDAGNPGAQYLWSTGEQTRQIAYPGPGQFWVRVDVGACQFYDTINIVRAPEDIFIHIPNAFTPTGDKLNDVYKIAEDGVKNLQVDIYNRWGEHLYSSDDIYFKWDGTYLGVPVPEGIYYYVIRYRTFCDKSVPATRSGVIHLLR